MFKKCWTFLLLSVVFGEWNVPEMVEDEFLMRDDFNNLRWRADGDNNTV